VRAIADLIYTRKQVNWERDGLAFLTESMRIERDDLKKVSFESLDEVCQSLRDRRTTDYLRGWYRELEK
jgi:hypothetical protein